MWEKSRLPRKIKDRYDKNKFVKKEIEDSCKKIKFV